MEVSNGADTTSIKLKPVCIFVLSFPSKPCPTPILLYLAIYFCIMSATGKVVCRKVCFIDRTPPSYIVFGFLFALPYRNEFIDGMGLFGCMQLEYIGNN